MKKILLLMGLLCVSPTIFSQTNTFPTSGNVGIGVTTPTSKLDVLGDIRMRQGEGFRLFGDTNYFGTYFDGIIFSMEDGNATNGSTDGGFVFQGYTPTDGIAKEWMVIKTGGKVGIGTPTPGAKLHVFNGNNSYGSILANANESAFSLYTKTFTTVPYTEVFRMGLKHNTDENNGFISFYRGGDTFGGFLGFSTNGNESMRLDAEGDLGLGMTNPVQRLSINKNIGTAYTTTNPDEFGNSSDMMALYNSGNAVTNVYTSLFFRNNGSSGNATGRMVLVNQTSGQGSFAFQLRDNSHTGETREKMRLTSDGYLGIGISNPTVALDVSGSLKTTGTVSGGKAYFQDTSDTQLRLLGIDSWSGIEFKDVADRDFLWFNGQNKTFSIGGSGSNVSGKKLHVEGGTSIGNSYRGSAVPASGLAVEGMVGVGFNAPTQKLDVNGNVRIYGNNARLFMGGFSGSTFGMAYSAQYPNYGIFYTEGSPDHVSISPNGSTTNGVLNVFGDGKVGIGTATPDSDLTVVGNVNIGGTVNRSLKVRHIDGKDFDSAGVDHLYLNYSNQKNVWIGSATNPANLIANGKIAVGTTSVPAEFHLAVAGKTITEEVNVQLQSSWPDFVFEDDYDLPSLKEVEGHIKTNGHLQGIPSARKVKENGILIGEMNAKLLQKIEELTLYTIAQEKALEKQQADLKQKDQKDQELQKRVQKLEKENAQLKDLLKRVAKLEEAQKK